MAGKAKFVFWWDGAGDKSQPLVFFNVLSNDRGLRNGSTVDGEGLLKDYGIPLPLFPDYRTWLREVSAGRRCRHCWASIEDNCFHVKNMTQQHQIAAAANC